MPLASIKINFFKHPGRLYQQNGLSTKRFYIMPMRLKNFQMIEYLLNLRILPYPNEKCRAVFEERALFCSDWNCYDRLALAAYGF